MSTYNYSYNVLINRLEAFAAGHFLIKRFTHGQIDLADQLQDDEYPFMHVTPDTITPVQGGMQFGFHIIFADIPRDKELKAEYQREVISDCVRLGQDLIAEVRNGLNLFGFNVQLVNNPTFEPFMEEYKNTLTGVAFTIELEVPWDWSACNIPAIWSVGGESTGGAGTPYSLLLQTNNVDNNVQSLLNLVNGTNITIVDNGDGSVTINAIGDGTGTVTSVDITAPAAFNVTGGPITTSGTIAITGAGNSSQYIDGTGALQTLPSITPQVNSDWNAVSGVAEILNKPTLATVATSGDYNDLSNLPTIPPAQVNSDWNAVSGVAQILNKPTIPTAQGLQDVITQDPILTTSNNIQTAANNFVLQGASGNIITALELTPGTAQLGAYNVVVSPYSNTGADVRFTGDIGYFEGSDFNTGNYIAVRVDASINELQIVTPNVNLSAASNGQVLSLTNAGTGAVEFVTLPSGSGTVTSVGLSVPAPANAALTVTNSPVTTSGTIAISANGTSSQLIDGTGALQTIPTAGLKSGSATQISAGVYTTTITGVASYAAGDSYMIKFDTVNDGASTLNINGLGAKDIFKNTIIPLSEGDIKANQEIMVVYDGTNFQAIGLVANQLLAHVHNAEGSTITKGQVVYAYQASGNKMSVKLARADADATSAKTIGFVYDASIANGAEGYIIIQGVIEGVDTSAFSAGDTLYLSGTTAGAVTATKQYAPIHLVYVGIVERANAGNGQIYVRCQNGYELDELHNVQAQSPADKDTLWYDNSVTPKQWKTASIPTILGYTPVTNARTISTTSPLSGGGDLSANRTLSIADAAADGSTKGAAAFTAADFNASSGVISLDYTNGQKASAAQPGFLSAADWSTFNGKASNASYVYVTNPNATQAASTTRFWSIGSTLNGTNETNLQIVVPVAGTIQNFYVRMNGAQPASGSFVLTVRKNGANTALAITITSADGTTFTKSNTANTFSVAAGDLLTVQGVNNATTQTGAIICLTMQLVI